ncbi:MAG: hypothetical protein CM1200mP8_2150 [Chloroflexota bacterium]|nr:MAG: hypothetical protein CM1200mP8_2150 [Chloroflexota bacterium]
MSFYLLGGVACSGTTSEEEAVDDFSTDATFFTGQSGDEEYTGEAKPVVAGETRGFETASVMRNKRGGSWSRFTPRRSGLCCWGARFRQPARHYLYFC